MVATIVDVVIVPKAVATTTSGMIEKQLSIPRYELAKSHNRHGRYPARRRVHSLVHHATATPYNETKGEFIEYHADTSIDTLTSRTRQVIRPSQRRSRKNGTNSRTPEDALDRCGIARSTADERGVGGSYKPEGSWCHNFHARQPIGKPPVHVRHRVRRKMYKCKCLGHARGDNTDVVAARTTYHHSPSRSYVYGTAFDCSGRQRFRSRRVSHHLFQ